MVQRHSIPIFYIIKACVDNFAAKFVITNL